MNVATKAIAARLVRGILMFFRSRPIALLGCACCVVLTCFAVVYRITEVHYRLDIAWSEGFVTFEPATSKGHLPVADSSAPALGPTNAGAPLVVSSSAATK